MTRKQMNYMNMDTGVVTESHEEAVEWFNTGVNIGLYSWSDVCQEWIVRCVWEH